MNQKTINHRRVTRLVKSIISYEVYKANSYLDSLRREPDSEATKAMEGTFIPGIEIVTSGRNRKEYVTVNEEFLELIGYEGNLEGFLADYFGTDYVPASDDPLKFRYIDGLLINPTKVSK
jgi:hypothetical protein